MHYANIKYHTIENGPGVRTSLFVSGCPIHCEGCFQPETWNYDFGTKFKDSTMAEILLSLKDDNVQGITILGGEPFALKNKGVVLKIIQEIRKEFRRTKDVWVYSGYRYEKLYHGNTQYKSIEEMILEQADVLVDGPFILSQKDMSLKYRGSRNQRLVDLNKTEGFKISLWKDEVENARSKKH